jgi:hypothetical protein
VFVRRISTTAPTLDVADLVSGGDGTTRRRGFAIDVLTGASGVLASVSLVKGGGYHGVPGLPVVDGCFIPNGAGGAERVDSAGHQFAFPVTSGEGFNRIWAGGQVPWPESFKPLYEGRVGGVDYSSPDHGLLLLHSNVGLTLDLTAIRRLHPGQKLVRFRAVAGNASRAEVSRARADVFVLVDGVARVDRRGFMNDEAPFEVDVPIRDTDRFLTLASTDGGDGNQFDWVTYGDPKFDLAPNPENP